MYHYQPREGELFIDLSFEYHQVCFLRCTRLPGQPGKLYASGFYKDQSVELELSKLSGDFFPNLITHKVLQEEFEEIRLYVPPIIAYIKRLLYETPLHQKNKEEMEQRIKEKFHLPPEWIKPILKYILCQETIILFEKRKEGDFFTIPSIFHKKPGKRLHNQSIIDKLFLEQE